MKTFINKSILSLIIFFSLFSFAYTQTVKEMFDKSWNTKDTAEKRTLREQIVKNSPDSEYGLFCRAWLLKNDNTGAIDLYTQAIKIKQDFWEAYNNRGYIYHAVKEYDKAISDYTKAIKINPNFEDAYSNRGTCYFALKEYDEAISDFTEAIKINPKDEYSYFRRGTCYFVLKEYDEAISDFTKAITINPKNEYAYFDRGGCYYYLKEYDEAISDYTEAIKINPKYEKAYYNKGNCYFELKEYDEAISDFFKTIKINPKKGEAYFSIGSAYSNLGNKTKACEYWRKASTLGYNDENNYLDKYNCEINYEEELNKFKDVAEKYRNLDPKPELSEGLRKLIVQATSLTKDKLYNDAIKKYKEAIKIDETFPLAHFNLALNYAQVEKYKNAIFEMKKYLMLVPDASDARAAQDLIYEWEVKLEK